MGPPDEERVRSGGARRAAVLGSPVAHSLSPVLHGAAYAALGLTGWTYERVECDAAGLPGLVGGLDDAWVGLSVTMPGKRAALQVATSATGRAERLGVANTLVRAGDAWAADCTDVDGVAGALLAAGLEGCSGHADGPAEVVVLGAGGTAAAVVGGVHQLGGGGLTFVVRDVGRAREVLDVSAGHGTRARAITLDEVGPDDLAGAAALVGTVPAGALDPARAASLVGALPDSAVVLDAVYHPWPTPLAAAAHDRGLAVATGLDMLLHQAFGQVEQFTGMPAPRAAMHAALVDATGFPVRPPA